MIKLTKCKLGLAFALPYIISCASSGDKPTSASRRHTPVPSVESASSPTSSYQAVGIASWYGGKFHGRKTASGERFNQNALTCAHRTLPFGTALKVTNLANGKSIVVRVNDRGPVSKKRLIDLSKAAAKALDFLKSGLAKVDIEQVSSK